MAHRVFEFNESSGKVGGPDDCFMIDEKGEKKIKDFEVGGTVWITNSRKRVEQVLIIKKIHRYDADGELIETLE